MLTREGLQEQAKLLGLPLNKQRAIIREYTQTIVLKAIYQSEIGRKLPVVGLCILGQRWIQQGCNKFEFSFAS